MFKRKSEKKMAAPASAMKGDLEVRTYRRVGASASLDCHHRSSPICDAAFRPLRMRARRRSELPLKSSF
jgi:hypothetical protein